LPNNNTTNNNNIVALCLSDAPANGSLSGFSSGRVTTVRSRPGDVLEFVAPIGAAVNDTGSCAGAWCEWWHVLEFCRYNLFTLYTNTHQEGWQLINCPTAHPRAP